MPNRKIPSFIFILILLLAIFFRFYKLFSVPSHPTLDEVSIGYNAFSILQTGKDEFGNKFPILLRAYDDYRPALYVYLVIPFVGLNGLSVESVRLPSVILSILSVVAMYFLAKEFLPKNFKSRNIGALFVMFLCAVSPWSIYISRLGHEANAGSAFFIFGLLFFMRFVQGSKFLTYKNFQLPLSSIFFALSFSSYQSEKIFIPLFVFLLFILYRKLLMSEKKVFFLSLLLGIFISLPVFASSFDTDALIRFSGTNVFTSEHPVLTESTRRIQLNNGNEDVFQKIFDNRRVGVVLVSMQGLLSHFNPVWLLANVGGENFKAPDFGLLSFPEAVLIFFGFIYLIKTNAVSGKIKIVFLGWLLFSILPAAITTDYPHAMRSMTVLFLPQIIAGFGLLFLLQQVKNRNLLLSCVIFIFGVNTLWFFHSYFTNFKIEESYRFQHGVLDALVFAKENESEFESIVVSTQGVLRASYMYYLFNEKYDPFAYQASGQNENGRFDTERKLGKYIFIDPSKKEVTGSPLLIIPASSQPKDNYQILKTIMYLDNAESIWVAVNK